MDALVIFTVSAISLAVNPPNHDNRSRACRTGSRSPEPEESDSGGRKVRSPLGNMPANGRGGSLKASFTESATENYTACRVFLAGKGEKVR
jgi:hypothetical protein